MSRTLRPSLKRIASRVRSIICAGGSDSANLDDMLIALLGGGLSLPQSLIEDLLQRCRTQGWSRLYWHTRDSNREARRLYDKFVNADDFVRYRMILD